MKLAIVGSVSLEGNKEAKFIIKQSIKDFSPTVIISGGAKGIDTMAANIAKELGIKCLEYLPLKPKWYYYKKRNAIIAENCDMLIRIVASNSKTYGSGWTRDYAKSLGKLTKEYVIKVNK